MHIEYKTTVTDLAPSDANPFDQDKSVPDPAKPSGSGWELIHVAIGGRKVYYTWKRGNNVVTLNASYIANEDDEYLLADASASGLTITLPTALLAVRLVVKKIDSSSNPVYLVPVSGQTVDGQTQITISTQYDAIQIVSNGSNWYLV